MARGGLRDTVLTDLAQRLPQWDLFSDDDAFERVLGSVTWRLHLSITNNPVDFDVIADVAVEHHRHGESICVVGTELGAAAGERTKVWNVASARDASLAVDELYVAFAAAGLLFLQRYSSVPEILRALRASAREASLLRPFVMGWPAEADAIEARWQGA